LAVADSHGLPVALSIESASPHEVKLVDSTLVEMVIAETPENLVGDNAYDSDKLDAELRQYGIELIAPHRSNRENKNPGRPGLVGVVQQVRESDRTPGRGSTPHRRVGRSSIASRQHRSEHTWS